MSRTGAVHDGVGTLARRHGCYRTLDGGAVGCCTCTTRPGPPSPAVITVRYRRTSGVPAAGSTILRMGPTALTIAAPAGFVVNRASGSTVPVPSAFAVSASTYGCAGSRPTT